MCNDSWSLSTYIFQVNIWPMSKCNWFWPWLSCCSYPSPKINPIDANLTVCRISDKQMKKYWETTLFCDTVFGLLSHVSINARISNLHLKNSHLIIFQHGKLATPIQTRKPNYKYKLWYCLIILIIIILAAS